MNSGNISRREALGLFITANIFFLFALFMAVANFQERSLGDTGYRIFYLLNNGNFSASNNRWILALVQILPLAGKLLNLDMMLILILYSIGDSLLFYGLFLFVFIRLKEPLFALGLVLGYFFSLGFIYFNWPDLEKHLQVGLILFLYVWLHKRRITKPAHSIAFALLFLLIMYGHPMGIPCAFFVFAWHFDYRNRYHWLAALMSLVVLVLRVFSLDLYETTRFNSLETAMVIEPATISSSLKDILINNWVSWVILALIIYSGIRQKKYQRLSMVVGFVVVYLLVLLLKVAPVFHEPYLLPLFSLLIVIGIDWIILPLRNDQRKWAYLFMGLIVLIDILSVFNAAEKYTLRVEHIRRLSTQVPYYSPQRKFIIEDENIPEKLRSTSYGYDYSETLLLTSINGKGHSAIFIPRSHVEQCIKTVSKYFPAGTLEAHFRKEDIPPGKDTACYLANIFFKETYIPDNQPMMWFDSDLNQDYFGVGKETFVPLQRKKVNDSLFVNVSIDTIVAEKVLPRIKPFTFHIKIQNLLPEPLYSHKQNGLKLVGTWHSASGSYWYDKSDLLEIDITREYVQPFRVAVPFDRGEYTFEISLQRNGAVIDRSALVSIVVK